MICTHMRLKNGTEEPAAIVEAVMMTLELLFASEPILTYELVELARNPKHVLWRNSGAKLAELALLDHNQQMQTSVRNVVLSAVTGEALEMTLGSPVLPLETLPTETFLAEARAVLDRK